MFDRKIDGKGKTESALLVVSLVFAFVVAVFPAVKTTQAATDSWTLVTDSRPLKAYPNLLENVWQKNASMPPNGQYDKIGLHRLVKSGVTPKGVVFFLPQAYGSGDQMISNLPTSNYTRTEGNTFTIYWANRGFDVYAMDYRTHFVPISLNASQLGFMADWGWAQWISDMKEAVDKTKEISGATKVFIAGFLQGGNFAMQYASKYWQQDLRGIVLLNANGDAIVKSSTVTNSFDFAGAMSTIRAGNWSFECANLAPTSTAYPPGSLLNWRYFAENPGGPAVNAPGTPQAGTPRTPTINPLTNAPWANITELMMYSANQTSFRMFANVVGGYNNGYDFYQWIAAMDRYWPSRLYYEMADVLDRTNSPNVAYDFDEYYKDINVPILGFRSGLNLNLYVNYTNAYATSDFTVSVVPNYGIFDLAVGTYSARDVSQPALDWMLSHYQPPSASAFCSVTVMTGQTWYFFAHSAGSVGPNTYQWYEGTTLLAGQTSMLLPITKTTAGTYTYTCRVTDAEGTTANSNAITLTVINR
jgi:pimeloyl-ACP methyl ester carboxylesterase